MILDERTEFADAVSLINNAGASYVLGDQIDTGGAGLLLGSAGDGVNEVDDLELVIQIDTAVEAAAGAATVQFHLVSDDTASLATNGTATYHWSSAAIAKGTLVAGYTVARVKLPKGTYERYIGVIYTIATNNITAGKANAFLTPASVSQRAFPDAI